ncbi:MAG: N-6 DNA methylase [Elusimicrobiota bacterium]|jgi:type I restriction enzyme M protein|nr:N-6 DNA methylase [Elusimicrobiota bacterium]
MIKNTKNAPSEMFTRTNINIRLLHLGFNLNEQDISCNVYQERAKIDEQKKLLSPNFPDYVIYKSNSNTPIAIIEAKRVGIPLGDALNQAIEKYAKPLGVQIVFVSNNTSVCGYHLKYKLPLKIDDEEIQDFVDEDTILKFIENPNLTFKSQSIKFDKESLLSLYKEANDILRDAGLRSGYERFSAFADILFLKLIDETEEQSKAANSVNIFSWQSLIDKKEGELLVFFNDSVKPRLMKKYGGVFDSSFSIQKELYLRRLLNLVGRVKLSQTDSDVKGDAFEFFLKNVTNGNKDLGEYYTPRHIVKTIVNLIDPKYGEIVYDPFCGTGGFLLEAFKYLYKRTDVSNIDILSTLRQKSIFGREITSTSRIAKMNMVLFGDGHSNIEQIDSLERPIDEIYDVVISNIPYSQKTKYGSLYEIPSDNADSVCVQHMWRALKQGGRMAVIVPEPFLYEEGIIGQTRNLILSHSSDVSVISLPRGVFSPYTPTKTSILMATKAKNKPKSVYFYVINNDGFELNGKRKPIAGMSDCQLLLSSFNEKPSAPPQSLNVDFDICKKKNNLFPFNFMEDLPEQKNSKSFVSLMEIMVEHKEKFDLQKADEQVAMLEVSQNGIFLSDMLPAEEFDNKHKVVHAGDIVYNPHRINIGSIGVVPDIHSTMVVSPIYVTCRLTDDNISPYYIVALLKSVEYKRIIEHYMLGGARGILSYSQLIKIKVNELTKEEKKKYLEIGNTIQLSYEKYLEAINLLNKRHKK